LIHKKEPEKMLTNAKVAGNFHTLNKCLLATPNATGCSHSRGMERLESYTFSCTLQLYPKVTRGVTTLQAESCQLKSEAAKSSENLVTG